LCITNLYPNVPLNDEMAAPLPPAVAIQEMDPGRSSASSTTIAVNAKRKLNSRIPGFPDSNRRVPEFAEV